MFSLLLLVYTAGGQYSVESFTLGEFSLMRFSEIKVKRKK